MRPRWLVPAVLALSALLAGCEPGDFGSSRVYFDPLRYRLTAEVETPEGVKTGSSVIQTIWDRGITGATVTGEAVAVDLPHGEVMFVLLRTPTNPDWAGGVPGLKPPPPATPPGNADEREADAQRQLDWMHGNRDVHYLWGGTVPRERTQYLPYMVRFRDVADPTSVEQIDPADVSKALGSGYRLISLTVQVTDEPVTMGIHKALVWLSKHPEPPLAPIPGGGVTTPSLGQFLKHGDFIKGWHE